MRRTKIVFVMITFALVSLSVVSSDAKAPGPEGRIVFMSGPAGEDPSRVFTVNPDGSDPRELPVPVGSCFRWSPDGTELATTADSPYGGRPATMNPDGSGFTVLDATTVIMNLVCPSWSPDGTRIAVEGFNDDDPSIVHGIYTVRASDGGDLRLLTGSGICPCDYSPDGTRIAFQAGVDQVGVVNTDGTGLRLITPQHFCGDSGLSWSPDGRWIVFGRPGSGNVYVVHPNGTGLDQIAIPGGGRGRVRAFSPGWSPGGTRIVFSMFTAASGQVDIYTARIDGSDLVRVTDTPDLDLFADWGPSSA